MIRILYNSNLPFELQILLIRGIDIEIIEWSIYIYIYIRKWNILFLIDKVNYGFRTLRILAVRLSP